MSMPNMSRCKLFLQGVGGRGDGDRRPLKTYQIGQALQKPSRPLQGLTVFDGSPISEIDAAVATRRSRQQARAGSAGAALSTATLLLHTIR